MAYCHAAWGGEVGSVLGIRAMRRPAPGAQRVLVEPPPDRDPADVCGDARLQHVAAQFRAAEPRQGQPRLGGQSHSRAFTSATTRGGKSGRAASPRTVLESVDAFQEEGRGEALAVCGQARTSTETREAVQRGCGATERAALRVGGSAGASGAGGSCRDVCRAASSRHRRAPTDPSPP